MSLPYETAMKLMAYADGELGDDEAAEVEALLSRSEEARQVLASLTGGAGAAVGAWVGDTYAARAASAPQIVDAVMARLDASAEPRVENVRSLEAARQARAVPRRRPSVWILAAVAVSAVAAGGLVLLRGTTPAPHVPPVAAVATEAVSVAPRPAPLPSPSADPTKDEGAFAQGEGAGVEVNGVDTPSGEVSVFYLSSAGAANAQSVVIWVGDDKSGGSR